MDNFSTSKTILEDQRKKQNDINSDARLKRREDMLARARRTPSPPPNAGDSARVSNAERAATLATLALGNEEEEEEEMEEEEEEETTATVTNSSAPSTRSRDTTNYQVRLKSVGQAIAKTVRQFLIDRGVKSDSEESKSIEQYMRHVYRYLNYCEELNPNEERNSYYISRQMFEDYLRWYEEKIGRSQNDYRHVSVALGHVVRCFLELDEKKISESGVVGGDEDESEMYFRSSDGLSRADAKTIAARAGIDVQANHGFWHVGNGKSLLSKKKTDVNLAKMKARNDGVVPTTQGAAVDAIIEENVFYGAANVAMKRFLSAGDESELLNESLRSVRYTMSQFLGRPGEILHYKESGLMVREPLHSHNPNRRQAVEFRVIATEHKGNTSMTKSSGQNLDRPVERLAYRHEVLHMCPIGCMARDIHMQRCILQRETDFRKREIVVNDAGIKATAVSWRKETIFGAGGTFKKTDRVLQQKKNGLTALKRREKTVPGTEFNKLFAGVGEELGLRKRQHYGKTYLRATRVTLAMERTEDQESKEALKKMGGWSGTGGNVYEDSYLFALPFKAGAALAGGSSRSDGVVIYTLEGNRDTLLVDEALIARFASGLVLKAESAYKDMDENGWPSAIDGVRGEEDKDLHRFKNAIRKLAVVFWQDVATLCATREGAENSYFIRACVLDELANDSEATRAWKLLVEEARKRKKSADTVAEARRNDSAEVRSVTEVVGSGMSEISRMLTQQSEHSNKEREEAKREKTDFAKSLLHLALQQLDDGPLREQVEKALVPSKRGSSSTSLAPPSPKKAKNSTQVEENRVTLLSLERDRVHNSTSIEDFRANYESDSTSAWGKANAERLKESGDRKKYNNHMELMRKHRSNAKLRFSNLHLALDGVDATDFNKRLLQKVAPEKSFNHIKDDEVKKLIVKEFGRVASKLNEKRKEASEMQVAEAKPFLRRTLEEEWPQLSTTPANGDDEMEEED
jgi:hypothetical protein